MATTAKPRSKASKPPAIDNSTLRMQKLRDKKKEQGLIRIELWVLPECVPKFRALETKLSPMDEM